MGKRKEKLISVAGVSQTGWKRAGMGGLKATEERRVQTLYVWILGQKEWMEPK